MDFTNWNRFARPLAAACLLSGACELTAPSRGLDAGPPATDAAAATPGDAGGSDAAVLEAGTVRDAGAGLLVISTNGGRHGLGTWGVLDPITLSGAITVADATGSPTPGDEFMDGLHGGFTYSPADNRFYAVLPGSGFDQPKHHGTIQYGPPGDVVRFDPVINRLEHLATIPLMDPWGTGRQLRKFLTSPVISSDGKSLMLVAQAGGRFDVAPPGLDPQDESEEAGALVHLDIDPMSAHYGRFTAVYGFDSFGIPHGFADQIREVDGKPLLVKVAGADAISLLSKGVAMRLAPGSHGVTVNSSRSFLMQPTVASDWSQPWQLVGEPLAYYGDSIAPQTYWNADENTFWWATYSAFATLPEADAFCSVGLTAPIQSSSILYQDLGMRNPVSIFQLQGRNFGYVVTGGEGDMVEAKQQAKIVEVNPRVMVDNPTVRRTLFEYGTGSETRLSPAGVAVSQGSGYVYMTATSVPGVQALNDNLTLNRSLMAQGQAKPSSAPYMSTPLGALYLGGPSSPSTVDGPLPGRLDVLDARNFSLHNVVQGSVAVGWIFVGAPAIGGPANDPIQDRYVVAMALRGGANGDGAVIKVDRLTGERVSVPFGPSSVAGPVGRPLQLASGKVIGGAALRKQGGLDPLRSQYAIWAWDPHAATPAVTEHLLPGIDVDVGGGNMRLALPNAPATSFVRAQNGSLWTVANYLAYDNARFYPQSVALVALDPNTGAPTGEVHTWPTGNLRPDAFAPSAAARGNVLCFIVPTNDTLPFPTGQDKGRDLRCANLDSRDGNHHPAVTSLSLLPDAETPDGGVPAGVGTAAWNPLFGPTVLPATNTMYLMTTATGPASAPSVALQIFEVQVGSPITASLTLQHVVTAPGTDLPATPLFAASDGSLYYGTEAAKLMKFDPVAQSVTQVADLASAAAGFSSDCRGFLSETADGFLVGVVNDRDATSAASTRRAFRCQLSPAACSSAEIGNAVSERDPFPGLLPVRY